MLVKRDVIAGLSVILGFVVLACYGLLFEYLNPVSFGVFVICSALIAIIPIREYYTDKFNHSTILISLNCYTFILLMTQLIEMKNDADEGGGIVAAFTVWIFFRILIKKFSRQIDEFCHKYNL